jgi:hypothetical protein
MLLKWIIKWVLSLFEWGKPLAASITVNPPTLPVLHGGGCATQAQTTTSLLDLAAEVAELRADLRALRQVVLDRR